MNKDKRPTTKDEYLLRNISKIRHKDWELFVITRILHNLKDPNIEYVCQQYINPKNSKKYYLADICFPSLELYYEINENQHGEREHADADKIRQKEIQTQSGIKSQNKSKKIIDLLVKISYN